MSTTERHTKRHLSICTFAWMTVQHKKETLISKKFYLNNNDESHNSNNKTSTR